MNGDWPEWKRDYLSCDDNSYPGPEECAKMKVMNDALEKNLRGIKVMYFGSRGARGHVDGTAVSVFIVGRTPSGASSNRSRPPGGWSSSRRARRAAPCQPTLPRR
jgi:hypothetical protein